MNFEQMEVFCFHHTGQSVHIQSLHLSLTSTLANMRTYKMSSLKYSLTKLFPALLLETLYCSCDYLVLIKVWPVTGFLAVIKA